MGDVVPGDDLKGQELGAAGVGGEEEVGAAGQGPVVDVVGEGMIAEQDREIRQIGADMAVVDGNRVTVGVTAAADLAGGAAAVAVGGVAVVALLTQVHAAVAADGTVEIEGAGASGGGRAGGRAACGDRGGQQGREV